MIVMPIFLVIQEVVIEKQMGRWGGIYKQFDEYFGFTDKDVQELLEYYGISDSYGIVKDWYDGYQFGGVEKQFEEYLKKTISIRDTFVKRQMKENFPTGEAITKDSKEQNPSACFYHRILLGILGFKENWGVFSNRESGDGYSDILVEIEEEEIGIVIEVKYAEDGDLEGGCQKALDQIETRKYEESLQDEGMEHILKYGVACHKKRCKVELA